MSDMKVMRARRDFQAAHTTTLSLCNECPNVHMFLCDEAGDAFAVMTFSKDFAPAYAGHLIEHYGKPVHGEELPILAGVGLI